MRARNPFTSKRIPGGGPRVAIAPACLISCAWFFFLLFESPGGRAQATSSQALTTQASSTPASPQTGQTQVNPPTFRVTSNMVIVDAVVTDHSGNPVHGLRQEEFQVFEDGERQDISGFTEFSADSPPPATAPVHLPPDTYTNYEPTPTAAALTVVLLDALNTPAKDQIYVRQQMLKYVTHLPPGRPVAIFGLTSSLRIIQGFTSDPAVLAAALKSERAVPLQSPLLDDPNQVTTSDEIKEFFGSLSSNPEVAMMLNNLQQFEIEDSSTKVDLRVLATLEAFRTIAASLSGFPGRKNLVWFSGSFPLDIDATLLSNTLSSSRSYANQLRDTANELARDQVAVYPVDARGVGASMVYDPASNRPMRGGAAFEEAETQFEMSTFDEHSTMSRIAEETGGRAFFGNDLAQELTNAVTDGSNYYSLAYVPANSRYDGRFRKIKVKIPADLGYRVSYRRGYFADSPQTFQRPSAGDMRTNLQLSMQFGSPNALQIIFEAHVAPASPQPAPGSPPLGNLNPKLRGPLVRYEIDYFVAGGALALAGDSAQDDHRGALDFSAVAYDAYGRVLSTSRQLAKFNVPSAKLQSFREDLVSYHQQLDLPAGLVFLRVGVHDQTSDQAGSKEILLNVPKQVPSANP